MSIELVTVEVNGRGLNSDVFTSRLQSEWDRYRKTSQAPCVQTVSLAFGEVPSYMYCLEHKFGARTVCLACKALLGAQYTAGPVGNDKSN